MMKYPVFAMLVGACLLGQAAEDALTKSLAVSANGTLVVDIDFGSIEVVSHATKEVQIDVRRKVTLRSEAAETAFLAERPIVVSTDGSTLTVRARKPGKRMGWNWGGSKLEGKYLIKVPAGFAAELKIQGGKIEVKNLAGGVRANTSGGSLSFHGIQGGIDGDTSGGSIQVENSVGTLTLDTSGGSIRLDGGSGTLKAETSGGSISIKNFKGDASAETSGGSITFEKVHGELNGSTSGGSIKASTDALVEKEIRLETSGGGITLSVPASSAFELDAATSGGGVSSELPVEGAGKPQRSSLQGAVNGGGKLVKLRTSGGSIRIKKE